MFEKQGYVLVLFGTGKEALEFLETNVPDVFVAEIETPDIPGQELCATLKKHERLSRVPVILLTSSWRPEDYAESEKLGAIICKSKPFQPERLQQVIRLVAPPPASRFYENTTDEMLADRV